MKIMRLMVGAVIMSSLLFPSACFAVDDTGIVVRISDYSMPSSAKVGQSKEYSATIEYSMKVIGVELPWLGKYHVEVPTLFGKPVYEEGEFSSFSFTKKTGSQTGKSVWQGSKPTSGWGSKEVFATFTAKASTKGSSQAYIGTGPNTFPNANKYKSVTVK